MSTINKINVGGTEYEIGGGSGESKLYKHTIKVQPDGGEGYPYDITFTHLSSKSEPYSTMGELVPELTGGESYSCSSGAPIAMMFYDEHMEMFYFSAIDYPDEIEMYYDTISFDAVIKSDVVKSL